MIVTFCTYNIVVNSYVTWQSINKRLDSEPILLIVFIEINSLFGYYILSYLPLISDGFDRIFNGTTVNCSKRDFSVYRISVLRTRRRAN